MQRSRVCNPSWTGALGTDFGPAETVCYGTDGGVFFQDLKNLVVCGPGSIEQAHTVDEWISMEQIQLGTLGYAAAIQALCGA